MNDVVPPDDASTSPQRNRQTWIRLGLLGIVVALVAMWVYAFVFAPRDGVNPVRDKAWTTAAEAACKDASDALAPLVFTTRINSSNKASDLPEYVARLDKSTAVLQQLLDRLDALPRTSRKAQILVPQWMADYRVYLKDVRAWVDELRAGKLAKFGVSITNTGIPIDERISTFAIENRIRSCTPIELTNGGSTTTTTAQSTASQP